MSLEEWLEIKIAFEKEVSRMKELYRTNPAVFWRQTSVGKCSDRMRAYLDKTAELEREAEGAGWAE